METPLSPWSACSRDSHHYPFGKNSGISQVATINIISSYTGGAVHLFRFEGAVGEINIH